MLLGPMYKTFIKSTSLKVGLKCKDKLKQEDMIYLNVTSQPATSVVKPNKPAGPTGNWTIGWSGYLEKPGQ